MANRDFIRQMPEHSLGENRGLLGAIHLDPWLLVLLAVLLCAGLVVLYSGADGSVAIVESQGVRIGIGFLVMALLAQPDPAFYRRWSPLVYIAGVAGLLAVLLMGVGAKGAQRWLDLPGLPQFQPSEFMKLAVPAMAAWYLSRFYLPPSLSRLAIAVILVVLPMVLIIRQPDLGTALLVGAAGLVVVFFAGISWKLVGAFLALIGVTAPALWFFVMREYQKQRVLTLLNPESDPLGSGWNIIQSKTAIGSGGLTGKGWLEGTQSHLDFLPESHTDFIVAVLAEEFGFIGVLTLLLLYLLIIGRCFYIAVYAQDSFSRLLAGALTMTFFVYVFVNIGMVSGILPIVGVPLPLVSFGGTSIVTLMAGFGVMMSIHTHRRMLAA